MLTKRITSQKHGEPKKLTACAHHKTSDANDDNTNVDSKALQIVGWCVCDPGCYGSARPNSYIKLQKDSVDHNSENKERCLIKTVLADEIKIVMVMMIMIQITVILWFTTMKKIRALS